LPGRRNQGSRERAKGRNRRRLGPDGPARQRAWRGGVSTGFVLTLVSDFMALLAFAQTGAIRKMARPGDDAM
jgi:hypothetical protein